LGSHTPSNILSKFRSLQSKLGRNLLLKNMHVNLNQSYFIGRMGKLKITFMGILVLVEAKRFPSY